MFLFQGTSRNQAAEANSFPCPHWVSMLDPSRRYCFSVTNADTGRPITFEADFMRLIEARITINALKSPIRAIQRNKLLYAHNAGIPKG